MADTTTGGDAAEQNGGAATEGNEESPQGDSSQNDSGSGEGNAGDEGGDDDEGDEGDSDEDEAEVADDDVEPTVRRDNSYFVGMRHGKKAAKQAAKKDTGSDDGDEGDDEEGDDIHPDDAAILEGAVAKAVKPLTEKLAAQEDKAELDGFIANNPAFKPYQKKIERFMKHPSRAHLPINTVAMEAVGVEGMIKIGARLARSADTKKQTSKSAPGGGPRNTPAKAGVWDMPDEAFSKMQDDVRRKG